MSRFIVPIVLLVLASGACTGGSAVPQDDVRVAGTRTAMPAPPPVESDDAPRARMQAGTDSVEGVLVRLCRGNDCEAAEADPPRTLKLAEDGLMLFLVDEAPESARVEVRRDGSARVTERAGLEPATLMGFSSRLRQGRYDVRLIGRWDDRRAVWRFSLTVPRPRR